MRPKFLRKLLCRMGHFPPPRQQLPAIQRQHTEVCRVKAVNGGRGRRFIWAPWPRSTGVSEFIGGR